MPDIRDPNEDFRTVPVERRQDLRPGDYVEYGRVRGGEYGTHVAKVEWAGPGAAGLDDSHVMILDDETSITVFIRAWRPPNLPPATPAVVEALWGLYEAVMVERHRNEGARSLRVSAALGAVRLAANEARRTPGATS